MLIRASERVAVIGAGYSGIAVAANLARRSQHPLTIILIERNAGRVGGIAYATNNPHHLLNVPAGNMSAFADDPNHFVGWLNENGHQVSGGDFIARSTYKQYLHALLEELTLHPGVRLERVYGDVSSLQRVTNSYAIGFSDNSLIEADSVVLALGNVPPNPREDWINDPWDPDALDCVPRDQPVLIVGTGLTAVDVAMALHKRGRNAPMFAVSRHGLLPHSHRGVGLSVPVEMAELPLGSIRHLVRTLRAEMHSARTRGHDWRDVVGALRPHTQQLWASLTDVERERFMRHVRHHWEVARHRIAPRVAAEIEAMRNSGDLRVFAGRIRSHRVRAEHIDVNIVRRGEATPHALRVARVINCTGPNRDVRLANDAFIRNLLHDGIVRPGPLGFGIDTDVSGAVIDAHGDVSTSLFTLGPLRLGRLWETTAVPEIREQAVVVADNVLEAPMTG